MKQGWNCLAALKCQWQQGLYICSLSFSQCVLCNIFTLDTCLPGTGETKGTENQILHLIIFNMFSYTHSQDIENTN